MIQIKNQLTTKLLIAISILTNTIYCMAQTNWQTNPVGAIFAQSSQNMPTGVFRMTSGGFKVYTIVSGDKEFQPASLYYGKNDVNKAFVDSMAPDGKVPTSMNCFLLDHPDGYIMFDTGLPASKGGKTMGRLSQINVSTEKVKAIFITHGHFDHIGGLLDNDGKAAFPNAQVFIPSAERSFIASTGAETISLIESAYENRITYFHPGEILPYNVISIEATGHTPGHTVYQIGNLLFVGDIMHGPSIQLLNMNICANFDADTEQAIASREKILSFAAVNSLTVLGAHVPCNGVLF